MLGIITFGVRMFFLGFVIGALVAPRSGRDARRILRERFSQFMDALTEILALPEESIALPERGTRAGAGAAQSR